VLGSTLRVQGGGPAAAAAAAQWGRRAADGTFEVTASSHPPAFPTPQPTDISSVNLQFQSRLNSPNLPVYAR
jgi:hypothetical protein